MSYTNLDLNHPWFIYPRAFMSEYNNYSHYKNESIKLLKFIDFLYDDISNNHLDKKVLIPFIIGSPMEDALYKSNTDSKNWFQYKQLYPNYINNFIQYNDNNNKIIQIIIVSPDDIFGEDINKLPYFTTYCPYNFVKISQNEYIYVELNIIIRVNIFNCMMPCVESRKKITKKYNDLINNNLNFKEISSIFKITSYDQTMDDIKFIDYFYCSIEKLFGLVSNTNLEIIINSWVCFKNLDGFAEKYNMFPKILELANKFNIMATEWEFVDELFLTKIVSKYKFDNKNFQDCNLNYVFDELSNNFPINVMAHNLNNVFIVDFNSSYNLRSIDK